jgi:hypothetical protein
LPILGLALISNRCKGPKDTVPTPTHQEVLDSVDAASKDIKALVAAVLADLDVSEFPPAMAAELFATHGAATAAKLAAPATAPSGCPVSGKSATSCNTPSSAPSPVCVSAIAGAIAGALVATILLTLAKKK